MAICCAWTGEHSVVDVKLRSAGNEDCCAILQENIREIDDANGLPLTWTLDGRSVNTVELPCRHNFQISALAMHFVTYDMRCPVCRDGPSEKMQLSSIPDQIRQVFDLRVKSFEQEQITQNTPVMILNASSIRRGWFLILDIVVEDKQITLASPMQPCILLDILDPGHEEFYVQRHFRRKVSNVLTHLTSSFPPERIFLRFTVRHCLMDHFVATQVVSHNEIENMLHGRCFTRQSSSNLNLQVHQQYVGRIHIPVLRAGVEDPAEWGRAFRVMINTHVLYSLAIASIEVQLTEHALQSGLQEGIQINFIGQ